MLSFYLATLESDEDKETMTKIYEDYKNQCHLYAWTFLDNEGDVEDAVHSAFLEVIKRKDKMFALKPSDFKRYLVVIVRNKALDILRARKRVRPYEDEFLTFAADTAPTMDETLSGKELVELVLQAMEELSPEHKLVITLKILEEKKNPEIAKIMGLSKKQTENTLYSARISLRKKMLSMGVQNESERV